MGLILQDDTFVITPINEKEAYLGVGSDDDGNGFVDKTNVKGEIIIPPFICGYTITGIKTYATRNCKLITSLTLPNTITHLDRASFTWCDGLETVVFPSSIETMDGNIDYFHYAKHIYFEKNSRIRSIGENFLRVCQELTEFTFPKSLQSLGSLAFDQCPKLIKVSFCGETDLSSIENPFRSSSNVLVLVTRNYKGASFGNKAIVVVPYNLCIYNQIFCPTIYNKNTSYSLSLLVFILIYSIK